MGALGRSLGDFGSQVGQGQDIAIDWRQRLQNLAMQQAKQKQDALIAPLQLQELQQRIRQMQVPQYRGTAALPGGGVGAISTDPNTGKASLSNLVGSPITPQAVGSQILQGRSVLSPNDQPYADSLLNELKIGVDPSKVLDKWQSFFGGASKASKQKPPVVDVNKGTVVTYDAFGNGTELPIYDEKGGINKSLPPEMQSLVSSQVNAFKQKDLQKQRDEALQSDRILSRVEQGENFRAGQSDKSQKRADATRAVSEAINAFRAYQSAGAANTKFGATQHWYNPFSYGRQDVLSPQVDAGQQDAEGKRVAAIQALKDAGMPVPGWLNQPIGAPNAIPPPTAPPPPGFVVNK